MCCCDPLNVDHNALGINLDGEKFEPGLKSWRFSFCAGFFLSLMRWESKKEKKKEKKLFPSEHYISAVMDPNKSPSCFSL